MWAVDNLDKNSELHKVKLVLITEQVVVEIVIYEVTVKVRC